MTETIDLSREKLTRERILDFGGGEDLGGNDGRYRALLEKLRNGTLTEADKAPFREEAQRHFEKMRAVKLARQFPEKDFVVFDEFITSTLFPEFVEGLPNLTFEVGKFNNKNRLPFPNASFSEVEMNFVFSPLLDATITEEQRVLKENLSIRIPEWDDVTPGAQARRRQQELGLPNPLTYAERLTEVISRVIHAPEDIKVYTDVVKEAWRVLKPGGKLIICEKLNRLERMRELLGWSEGHLSDLETMGGWFQQQGFGRVKTFPLTDAERTSYAKSPVKAAEEGREMDRPWVLEIEKVT